MRSLPILVVGQVFHPRKEVDCMLELLISIEEAIALEELLRGREGMRDLWMRVGDLLFREDVMKTGLEDMDTSGVQ